MDLILSEAERGNPLSKVLSLLEWSLPGSRMRAKKVFMLFLATRSRGQNNSLEGGWSRRSAKRNIHIGTYCET